MKSYSFSLEKVLEWKENNEKNIMEEFAILQNEFQHEKSKLNILIQEYEETKNKGTKYKNIHELQQQDLYKRLLEDKIQGQEEVVNIASQKLEEVRLRLVAAQKERKIMEKLKEKDFNIYKKTMDSIEQKQLDEMAVLNYNKISLEGR